MFEMWLLCRLLSLCQWLLLRHENYFWDSNYFIVISHNEVSLDISPELLYVTVTPLYSSVMEWLGVKFNKNVDFILHHLAT